MRAGERPIREAQASSAGLRYDTALIKEDPGRLLAEYLGRPGKVSGSRLVWDCPGCGKPKLSLFRTKGAVGCLNAGCEVEGETDVIGVIASLEGLSTRGEDFRRVCALCYRLLSIPDPTGPATAPAADGDRRPPERAPERPASTNGKPDGAAVAPRRAPRPEPEAFSPAPPDVVDAVLSRLLHLCPLEDRDVRFLASRGVAEETARAGRFGSITNPKARHTVAVLDREFPREALLGVPGFRERGGGEELGFTLFGDFLLIPYFDRAGRVATLEGRAVGEVPGWAGKYTSLRNGGNHLYVFPGFDVDELVAICEGPMGAIVAAQEGLAVGAIQGVKRYTEAVAGGDAPLPELVGADFRGRTVLYVPDLDAKPDARADVEKHAARACEFLVGRQDGRPLIATVPQGAGGAKDLDAWILSVPEAGPAGVLRGLRSRAWPPNEWPGLPDPDGAAPDPPPAPPERTKVEREPEHKEPEHEEAHDPAPPEPDSAPEELIASDEDPRADGADGTELPADEDDDQGTTDEEEEAGDPEAGGEDEDGQDAAFGAYDRWYALLEGHPGSAVRAGRPQPYRPRDVASPVPPPFFADEAEFQWAALAGVVAALVFWYYVGASEGWLAGGVRFLPSLPDPLTVVYGLPFALLFGATFGALRLLRTRSKRLAARRHLLGEDRR